tara:strand:+ start:8071 stop:11784 length:3714 start_codon:yes stop_codon:yes gene_type:complete
MNEYEPSLEIGLSEGLSEEETAAAIQNSEAAEKTRAEIRAQKEAEDVQNEEDANLQDKPDLGDYIKDTGVGVVGGLQDTASSLVTLPERVIDFFSGEMGEEAKTEEGYQTEWDDWFVNDEKPIETKTWWGGLVRGVTHVGTTLAATGGIGGVAAKGASLGTRLASGALAGARFDLVSKTSQDDNVSGMLKEKIPFLDTPLATKEGDHPMMKTLKNVVEGMGIGLVFDGVYEGIKFGMDSVAGDQVTNFVKSTGAAAEYKGKKVISAAEEQWKNRNKNVNFQQVQKAKEQLKTKAYGAFKNSKISDVWQGTSFSNETAKSVRKGLKDIKTKWGAEEGTAGSFLSNVEVDNIARSSKESRKTVRQVLKKAYSQNKISQLEETAKRQGKSLDELVEFDVELSQRIYEGRNTSGLSPEEFWADITKQKFKAEGDASYEFVRPEFANTIDLINGSLLSDIRALGLTGRELQDVVDVRDVDGPAQQLVEKFIAGLRIRKQMKAEWSQMGRDLDQRVPRVRLDAEVDADVGQSIDAFRMALEMSGEDGGDDLFKAIFEGISMAKDIHTLEDFDAFMRQKLKGGTFKGGQKQTGALIREMGTMFTHSVLSGPKTAVRAIMGTSSATFTRPMAMALGGAMRGDWVTSRSALASLNAMREAVPESFELFKRRLNAYWGGDISTMKTRYIERTKADDQWQMYGHWAETRGSKSDKLTFRMANMVRGLNDNRFLTYSTKIMAATDDAFGLIIGRARAREKAFLKAADELPDGNFVDFDADFFKRMEDDFNSQIFDADGNITDAAAAYSKKEATLTQDLTGFTKKLETAFNETPWARPFFLFARTGINGLSLTAKHTPGFNFLVKEWNDIAFAKPGGDLTPLKAYGIENVQDLMNAKAVQQGRLAMGSAAIFMAGQAYLNGGLHGNGPTDRQKRQAWLDAGWKPRTIKLGNTWISYDAFEPYNQILALVGDIGDHQELMGEEWAEDRLSKLTMAIAGTITSKSYLAGLQSFVDLFSGQPGQQQRIIASLLNNTLPLSSLRNEIGKVLTPYTRELGSDIEDSIRNRNLISENIASDPLPIKYDILTGRPIKDHNFMTRMFNSVSPVNFNLDYSPGRELLFNSGYDLRTSTYAAPDGTDLSDSPKVRSMFQKAIGEQNLEKTLNEMAADEAIQLSVAEMNYERRSGNKSTEPRSFPHYKRIAKAIDRAKKRAWAKIKKENDVQKLLIDERNQKLQNRSANKRTIDKILDIPK